MGGFLRMKANRLGRYGSFLMSCFMVLFLAMGITACDCGAPPGVEGNLPDGGTIVDKTNQCPQELTPCNNDNECQTCGGGLICIAGQCSVDPRPDRKPTDTPPVVDEKPDVPPQQCPTLCSNHDDCPTSKCGERNECVNGVCSYPARKCPDSCTEDAQCLTPACGSSIRCYQGKCTKLPACPKECLSDDDCSLPTCGTRNRCISGFCAEPPKNDPPVAVALKSQKVSVGSLVRLDGSQSKDPDGDKLTYSWSFSSKPANSKTDFNDSTAVSPAFVPDVAGEYVIELLVNDGQLDSKPSVVRISATKNAGPTLLSLAPSTLVRPTTDFTVSLFGTNFDAGAKAVFKGLLGVTTFVNSTELRAKLPANPPVAKYSVYVQNSDGQISNVLTFAITNAPSDPPRVIRITPTEVKTNAAFTLSVVGEKFANGVTIQVDGQPYKTNFFSSGLLSAVLSKGLTAGLHTVNVVNPDGQASNSVTLRATTVQTSPVLDSVTPNSIFANQKLTLTLKGKRFVAGAKIRIAGQTFAAASVTSTQILVTVALSNAGNFGVEVLNPNGETSNRLSLEVKPPLSKPVIQTLSPATTTELTAVTVAVKGTGFVNGAKVTLNNIAYTTTFVSATELRVSLPATVKAGKYPVQVTNPDNQTSNIVGLLFNPKPPAPVLSALSPAKIPQGVTTTVTLTGNNFLRGAQVQVGTRLYPTTFVSGTRLTVSVTKGLTAGNYPVVVFNPDSQKSNTLQLNIFKYPAPVLKSISPTQGMTGQVVSVQLLGANFLNGAKGVFQGGQQNTRFVSATELAMTLSLNGLGAGTYQVWVQNADGQVSNKIAFTVDAPKGPQINQILPNKGATNTKVNILIDGTNFVKGATISFASKTIQTTFVNISSLSAVFDLTGIAAGTYPVKVTNPDGSESNNVYFTVSGQKLPAPVLTSVSPTQLKLGTNKPIYLTGKNFQNGALLMLPLPFVGSIGLPCNYINANTLVVTAQLPRIPFPFPARTINVYVQNPDKQNSNRKPVQISN